MTPTEPGFNAAELRTWAKAAHRLGNFMWMDPASILALLDEVDALWDQIHRNEDQATSTEAERDAALAEIDRLEDAAVIAGLDAQAERDALLAEVERLTDTEKAQGVMIRELERLNTELNDELGTAVQVLKLERAGLSRQVERLRGESDDIFAELKAITAERDAALAEVEQWKRDGECQCSMDPTYGGPEETCPVDGRTYTEWVQIASDVIGQNNILRARLAAVNRTLNELPTQYTVGAENFMRVFDLWQHDIRVALTEGPPVPRGPDPDGGIDLTDEEFAAFLKAAKS